MIITAIPVRDIDAGMFADLTPVPVVGMSWQADGLSVEFGSDLDAATQAAVVRRMRSRNANEEELRRLAEVALANNRAYLAIPTPTQAEAGAQIKAVARQINGIIRQLLGILDGTD